MYSLVLAVFCIENTLVILEAKFEELNYKHFVTVENV